MSAPSATIRSALAAVLLPLGSCALIDAMSGKGDGMGDGGVNGGDAGDRTCLADSEICFAAPTFYDTELTHPNALAIGRFDSGTPFDVVVASSSGAKVLFGDGQGGFSGSHMLTDEVEISGLAVGNFNGDGATDIALYDANLGLRVFYPLGTGGFDNIEYSQYVQPKGLVALDFESDGTDDLLIEQGGTAVPLANVGASNFQPKSSFAIQGGDPRGFVAADFTGEGYGDFAYMDGENLRFYDGEGSWGFGFAAPLPVPDLRALGSWSKIGESHAWLALLLVCSPCDGGNVLEMYNLGGMASAGTVSLEHDGFIPVGAARGSFDGPAGNGIAIASGHQGPNNVLILDGWDNTFQKTLALSVAPVDLAAIAAGDLNGDAVDDVVVAYANDGTLAIILSVPP